PRAVTRRPSTSSPVPSCGSTARRSPGWSTSCGRPVADLDGALDTTLGPTGPLQQLLDGLSTTPLDLGLVSVDLGGPQLHASVELDALLDGLLAGPLTSEDGLVSVDLTSGSVGVDLRSLVAGGDLNDLPPDTQLLTADNIGRIARAVTDL